jgi:hypothetical protein
MPKVVVSLCSVLLFKEMRRRRTLILGILVHFRHFTILGALLQKYLAFTPFTPDLFNNHRLGVHAFNDA